MELTHVEQMALFEGLMDAEYRKLKPLFPRCRLKKALFTGGIYFHIQNGRRHCEVEVGTIAATILPRKDRSWSLPGICKKFISPYWNSRTKPRWSCFLKYGIKREAHMILKYLLQRLVVPP